MKPLNYSFSIAFAMGLSSTAVAQVSADAINTLPEIKVSAKKNAAENYRIAPTGDTAQLLKNIPGYNVAAGGGVSGLPVMNGFADDRLKIRIDGREITSACANHMNAPLSYIDPKQVQKIALIAGITPVSVGGDSIGGTIEVESAAPIFASAGESLHSEGTFALSGRSIDNGISTSLSATVANDSLSLSYSGSHSRSDSYKSGNGDKVLGSMYESNNQAVTLSAKGEGQQVTLRAGEQRIPYQGFPNEYMDMTGNHAAFANLSYAGQFAWGKLDAKLYWQDTKHEMGFFSSERIGEMPMNTRGRDLGYSIKAEIPLQSSSTLRIGNEYHIFRLDDFWPAIPGSMMMGPQTYININDGKRDRLAFFGELETQANDQWSTLFGLRNEVVKMNTGDVQPYAFNMMNAKDAAAAAAFNSRNRNKRDNNLDLTALARFEPNKFSTYEFGYARKTRSPNLYERYSWGRGTMSMTMTNWFGDGNGYVGNIDLKPETANTLGITADWHAEDKTTWYFRVNPYYSDVKNYIDTDLIGPFNPYMIMSANANLLQFANHDARLYGINFSWKLPLLKNAGWGDIDFTGNASLTRGKRKDGGNLYHMMPFNALIAIEQAKGRWNNVLEGKIVTRKNRVDDQRLEPATAGYALFNLRTAYQLGKDTTITAGVSNLFDKTYADPLGGVYLSGLQANGGELQALPGYGRSLDVGISIKF